RAKSAVTLRSLRTDASHREAARTELRVQIADHAHFLRAARREIRGVEEQHQRAVVEQRGQRSVTTVLVRQRELGRSGAGSEHGLVSIRYRSGIIERDTTFVVLNCADGLCLGE